MEVFTSLQQQIKSLYIVYEGEVLETIGDEFQDCGGWSYPQNHFRMSEWLSSWIACSAHTPEEALDIAKAWDQRVNDWLRDRNRPLYTLPGQLEAIKEQAISQEWDLETLLSKPDCILSKMN